MTYGSKNPKTAKGKKPYKKNYRKKTTAMQVANRALALAKRNNKLSYGSYQLQLTHTNRAINITRDTPICFNVTTPVPDQPVFQWLPNILTGVYDVVQVANFGVPNLQQLTGGQTGSQDRNFWRDCNDDRFNGKYKLLNSNYEFRLLANTATQQAQPTGTKIRIDFYKPKWNRVMRYDESSTTSGKRILTLPDALGSFNGLMTPFNEVNPMYWNKIGKSHYMTLDTNNNQSTADIVRKVWLKHNMVMNPKTEEGVEYEPHANIPLNKQLWCVISADTFRDTNNLESLPSFYIKRTVSWRDGIGHGA